MSNNTFTQDLTIAREVFPTLHLKGERPMAVKEFLDAQTDDDRQNVVDGLGAGLIRRGLRQIAQRMDKVDHDKADVFWALRDDIDPDGEVFHLDVA